MGVDCLFLSLDWSLGGNLSLDKFGWLRLFILLIMKKILFYICLFFVCYSCTEDNRTLEYAYTNCFNCNGRGYVEKSEYFGLMTYYNDCFICKTKLENERNSNVTFEGSRVVLNNKPCDVCDCTVYRGYYKGYHTDCDCGHAYGAH